jgi:hypothetical protein
MIGYREGNMDKTAKFLLAVIAALLVVITWRTVEPVKLADAGSGPKLTFRWAKWHPNNEKAAYEMLAMIKQDLNDGYRFGGISSTTWNDEVWLHVIMTR